MGTKKGQARKTARKAYNSPKYKKAAKKSRQIGSASVFTNYNTGRPSKLTLKAQGDATGTKLLQLLKIDELLGFSKRRKK
tara:strand:+ start:10409 stop:10648 length:240 start_codon:yes stop_codon:yes gene_type:complete